MIGAAAAYMSGLFFASFFINKSGIIILSAVSIILYLIGRARKFSRFDFYIIIFSFLTAFTVSTAYSLNCYFKIIEYAGGNCYFSGKITDYEIYDGDRAYYVLKGKINDNQKAKISIYTFELDAKYGDIVTLENCTFKQPESDYLFNAETWYKSRHIFIQVDKAEDISVEHTNSAKVKNTLALFRENMISKIRLAVGEKAGGFLAGMIFGEKQYLDDNTKDSLYRMGIGHILAVSGLHISIIISLAMILMKKLKVNKFIRFGILNILLILLIIITNYPISAIRAALMLDIMYAAPLFRRQNDSLNSIAVTALIISVSDPYSVYNSGFILSLSATFGIAVFGPFMTEKMTKETKLQKFLVNFIIGICTAFSVMPVSMYYFDEISVISSFTNVLILPLCSIAMIFGLLYVITGGFITEFLYPSKILIESIIYLSDKVSKTDFISIPNMNRMFSLLFIIAGALTVCLFLLTGKKRIVSLSIALSMVFCSFTMIAIDKTRKNNMIIAVLGRGNNASVVISYGERIDVIDLSGHYRSAEYVRKYLSENGINNIDSLILTEKTASQDLNYEIALSLFEVNRRFAFNDIQIYSDRLQLLGDSEFSMDSGDYIIEYDNKTLKVIYHNSVVSVSSAKDNHYTDGLSVYYGNITKTTEIYDKSIYLDDGI
ncbi:MAG: ComEC/Rec2 family competence protein, partial [Ruminococcus sp.]|nr:ComEC/Rec2 family competence protein [Ruminococcus sp.]